MHFNYIRVGLLDTGNYKADERIASVIMGIREDPQLSEHPYIRTVLDAIDEDDKSFKIICAQLKGAFSNHPGFRNRVTKIRRNIDDNFALKRILQGSDFEDMKEAIESKRYRNMQINSRVFSAIVHNAPNLDEALALIDDKRFLTIRFDVILLRIILGKTCNLAEVHRVIYHDRLSGIKPDVKTLNIAIDKAPNLDQAYEMFDNKKFSDVELDTYTLNNLLSKATTTKETKKVINDERFSDVEFNTRTINAIFNTIRNFK